jgi:hypothetical protein
MNLLEPRKAAGDDGPIAQPVRLAAIDSGIAYLIK